MSEIRAVLDAQVAAWNRGDLEAFMASCADDIAYIGGDRVVRGRETVLSDYARRYADGMPRLSLSIVEIRETALTAIAVVTWDVGTASGHALLGFERREQRWLLCWDATVARNG